MHYLEEQMSTSKDYQLQSLISQFSRFYNESVCNTSSDILKESIYYAKKECDKRGISYK